MSSDGFPLLTTCLRHDDEGLAPILPE
jgi:hypothetical protein